MDTFKDGISIQMPVKIRLSALEKVIRQKLIGYKIKKGGSGDAKQFAEIQNVNICQAKDDYDLCIQQEILMKTILFENKRIKFRIQVKFEYDKTSQELKIATYKVNGREESWLTNKILKIIMNNLLRGKILDEAKIMLVPKIKELLQKTNEQLKNIIEVKKGIFLFGTVDTFKVCDLYFKEDALIAILKAEGALAAEVSELEIHN